VVFIRPCSSCRKPGMTMIGCDCVWAQSSHSYGRFRDAGRHRLASTELHSFDPRRRPRTLSWSKMPATRALAELSGIRASEVYISHSGHQYRLDDHHSRVFRRPYLLRILPVVLSMGQTAFMGCGLWVHHIVRIWPSAAVRRFTSPAASHHKRDPHRHSDLSSGLRTMVSGRDRCEATPMFVDDVWILCDIALAV